VAQFVARGAHLPNLSRTALSLRAQCYSSAVLAFGDEPLLSYANGDTEYQQVFNPSWVEASQGTDGKQGLLVRTQNCSGCQCCGCKGQANAGSAIAFVPLLGSDGSSSEPKFGRITRDSIVFAPRDQMDALGTEDPRVTYDPKQKLYHMIYTCFGKGEVVRLCRATTANPTISSGWTRHGPVAPGFTKSGALLLRNDDGGPHYMFWGNPAMRISTSTDLQKWDLGAPLFIDRTPWGGFMGVEAGPPPLRLSTGDYLFLLNSWNHDWPAAPGYQPWWVILSGKDPAKIIAHATEPLWTPDKKLWMEGTSRHPCNAKRVTFVSAAHPTEVQDTFRLYIGGADAVIGTAVVRFSNHAGVPCVEETGANSAVLLLTREQKKTKAKRATVELDSNGRAKSRRTRPTVHTQQRR